MTSRAYLDHASTSPLRPEAFDAMLPYLREEFADPGRVHTEGRMTRVALEDARERVAGFFGARPREVVFTSGGTEAVNTAVWGAVAHADGRGHVVTTAVEHSSVLDALARYDVEVTRVGVDRDGCFSVDDVVAAIRADTTFVSVQLANHEVGTVQPARAVSHAARERGVLVHVDACAAAGHALVSFGDLGADLCSVTTHKWGGPKGAGALLVRRGLRVPPFIVGGAQERARRGGIENVAAMIGFAAACDACDVAAESAAQRSFVDAAWEGIASLEGVERYGTGELPNILCFGVHGIEAEPIVLALDQRGVAVHSGSSCSSEMLEPSPVLEAMGVDAEHSLRVSVGWSTTRADIDRFTSALADILPRFRAMRR